jgi:RHH-type rel operon transcriptional repressor/antitoxin RelB
MNIGAPTMTISLRLEPQIERRIAKLAKATGKTKSHILRELVARGIEDVEDIYMADRAMERLRQGKERTYTSEEVSKKLGLDD